MILKKFPGVSITQYPDMTTSDCPPGGPDATDLRRFTLYGTSRDNPDGEVLGLGVEFPDGTVALDATYVQVPPSTFDSVENLVTDIIGAQSIGADGPGMDTWVEYEDVREDEDAVFR